MSDTVEYILKITDQGSQTMQKIGMGADSAVSKVQRLQKESMGLSQKIGAGNRNIVSPEAAQSVDKVTGKVRNLGSEIQKTDSKGKSAGGGWFSNAISQIPFAGLLTNPLVLAGAAAGKSIHLGIQQELSNTAFDVLLNSETAGKKMFDDIVGYSKKVKIYDRNKLADNAKTMLGFGVRTDQIMPDLKSIGDIAMGDANRMNSLTLAYSQMISTGKLMGQDLLQMINAGFNPLKVISDKTGKSIGQLKKEMEDGKISSQMITDAFHSAAAKGGQFYGMAEKLGGTLGGRFSSVMTNLNDKLLKLYEYISPAASKLLDFADILINKVATGIGWFINKLREGNPVILAITGYIAALTAGLIAYKTYVTIVSVVTRTWAAVQAILNGVMYANPIGLIIAAIVALIALIAYVIYNTEGWGKAWDHTVKAAQLLWQAFIETNKSAFNNFILSIQIGLNNIKKAWYQVKAMFGSDSANELIGQMNEQNDQLKTSIYNNQKKAADLWGSAGKEFNAAANSLSWKGKGFSDIKNDTMNALGISSPKGVAGTAGTGADGKDKKGKSGKGAKTNSSIATGGQRSNYITIQLKDLIGVLNIQGRDFKDSTDQMTEQTADALLRLLAMANATGG